MIRVIKVGSYDCENKYIVRVNNLTQHEYDELPFINLLSKPHRAEYRIEYVDYALIDDILQGYVQLMIDSRDQSTRRSSFDRLWDYLTGEEE